MGEDVTREFKLAFTFTFERESEGEKYPLPLPSSKKGLRGVKVVGESDVGVDVDK